jgi:hypothetical protein
MDQRNPQASPESQLPLQYEAPHIELVLTPEELEREVSYAGGGGSPG